MEYTKWNSTFIAGIILTLFWVCVWFAKPGTFRFTKKEVPAMLLITWAGLAVFNWIGHDGSLLTDLVNMLAAIVLAFAGALLFVLMDLSDTENYLCKNCYSETGKNDLEQKCTALG